MTSLFPGSVPRRETVKLHSFQKRFSKNVSLSEVPQIWFRMSFLEEACLMRVVRELRISLVHLWLLETVFNSLLKLLWWKQYPLLPAPWLPLNSWGSYSLVIHRTRFWIGGTSYDVRVLKQSLSEEKLEKNSITGLYTWYLNTRSPPKPC